MDRSILIIGAGGHGRVVADAARLSGHWKRIAFVDDRFPKLNSAGAWPVIGAVSELDSLVSDWREVAIAVGDNTTRIKMLGKAKTYDFSVASIIHPSAQIAEDVTIGEGAVVFANTVVNMGSVLGDVCIVNTAATVDHDNRIGAGVHLSPGVHLAGDVVIGDRSWIGIGAVIIQGCAVGHDVMVGAGAVVTKDIDNSLTVVGVPAREIVK